MILSIIIVNYNVKFFLEQCLCSVEKSLQASSFSGTAEVFVVDNHSTDSSVEYLLPKFPEVQFLPNSENIGFSRANNQALEKAKGKYILFLNPDTILAEDSLEKSVAFMESTPGAGAAGVRMVDGQGIFLKESKRGFPSPWAAFCKLTGLTALFPRSSFFAKYYLGHLPEGQTHPAPVLSGAFFLTTRKVLERTGGFDERFFLYGEDIDLSYRIEKAGYTNYYIAETTIVHFKGESTRKDTRYVKMFYKAMSQFRRKYFKKELSALFNILVEGGIWIRAGLAALAGVFRKEKRKVVSGINRAWIGGDPAGAERLLCLLPLSERTLVRDPRDADEIIYCEGPAFGFRQVIDSLGKGPRDVIYKIHAAGSDSLAGSHSKDGRGETLFFPPKA